MTLYGLRLLVAFLTFAVGVTAAWLLDFKSAPAADVATPVSVRIRDEPPPPPPPPRSCPNKHFTTVVQGGILNGKANSKPQPVYPPAAKAERVSGMVMVQIEVDESGRVAKAEAAGGPELLREAAEDAALKAQFSPTLLSGQPVRVSGVITYNFALD